MEHYACIGLLLLLLLLSSPITQTHSLVFNTLDYQILDLWKKGTIMTKKDYSIKDEHTLLCNDEVSPRESCAEGRQHQGAGKYP